MSETSDHRINGFSVVTLVVFFAVNILVVFPIYSPLPKWLTRPTILAAQKARILSIGTSGSTILSKKRSPGEELQPVPSEPEPVDRDQHELLNKRYTFPLGLSTAPVIGVFLLLATTSIPGSVVRTGIVGSQGVKPYDIMTLFISLAYISLSLDCTGLLRFLAFWVSIKGGTSGRKLYLFFFVFFFLFGVLVGNDPIILSGTSFLAYFSRIAGISPPRAWIFMQFAACNIASAVLVSSNPTNLVLTGAYEVSFLVFSAWTVLPVLATGAIVFPILVWGVFRGEEYIPKRLETPDVDPRSALIDRSGAIFGSSLLGITLALLVGLSAGGLLHGVEGVWTVTAPAALIMVARDLWFDIKKHGKGWSGGEPEPEALEMQGVGDLDGTSGAVEAGRDRTGPPVEERVPKKDQGENQARLRRTDASADNNLDHPPSAYSQTVQARPRTLQSLLHHLSIRFPTFTHVFVRLPLPLLPFAFSMFILVEALSYVGWIRVWGGWWTSWVEVAGLAGAIFLMGVLSVLGCNAFGTNIGATILLSRVLQQWSNNRAVSNRILYGSLYTLALGSNYGAFSYTFSASLAGLLWKAILQQKGIQVGRWEFFKYNAVIVVVCMIVGCLIVAAEVCVIYDS